MNATPIGADCRRAAAERGTESVVAPGQWPGASTSPQVPSCVTLLGPPVLFALAVAVRRGGTGGGRGAVAGRPGDRGGGCDVADWRALHGRLDRRGGDGGVGRQL